MEKVTQEELNEIIANHKKWIEAYGKYVVMRLIRDPYNIDYEDYLTGPPNSPMACIINKDLSDLDFSEANLEWSVFKGCDFTRANLCKVNFRVANLLGSSFNHANLKGIDLQYANLTDTNFIRARF